MNVFKCSECLDLPFHFVKSEGSEHFDTGFCNRHWQDWKKEHRIKVADVLDEIG